MGIPPLERTYHVLSSGVRAGRVRADLVWSVKHVPLGHGQGAARRRDDRRYRSRSGQDNGTGRPALAHPAWPHRLPKSMRRDRMQENLASFHFELSEDDVAQIDALDKGGSGRIGPNPDTYDWIP